MATQRTVNKDKLVSVICRTIGRPTLQHALQSVASQTYPCIELILVDAAALGTLDTGTLPDHIRLINVTPEASLARAAAANAGLDAATGDYLMFLDDDDWIAPGHIAELIALLLESTDCRAAYSDVRMTDVDGAETGTVFAHDFDPVLLRRDNYIPIHAVLFHRSLVADGCRFDESLDIYEDWDFWLQVNQHTTLQHNPRITAYYRGGGSSDTSAIDHEVRFQHGHPISLAREKIYEKWKSAWSGVQINELIGSLDKTEVLKAAYKRSATLHDELKAAQERSATLHDELLATNKLSGERLEQLNETHQQLDQTHQQLDQTNQQLDQTNQQLNLLSSSLEYVKESASRKITELQAELQTTRREFHLERSQFERHIRELETTLNAIYRLPSWRLMGPFRRIRRKADELLLNPLRKQLHLRRHGTEWNPSGTPQPNSETIATPTANPQPQNDLKTLYRAQAANNLRVFLENGLSIQLSAPEKPRVSILLVLYNQAPLTLLCLESIAQYATADCEVVIVDNASSDESTRMLEQIENARVIRNADNLGFVRAVNQGAEISRGEYLLLLNNDAMLHPGSIESALQTFESVPGTGAVGGKILLLDGALQEAGSIIFNDASCLGYGRHQRADSPEFMFRRPVDYCSGAFLIFPLALFRDMGGFDDDYAPAYYEESDFCIRLHKRGLRVLYDPDAVITHFEFASTGGQTKASELQASHRAILLEKHQDYLASKSAPVAGNQLHTRTLSDGPNILFIDDCVPHASLGSGYPRCREMVHALAAADANLSFYPLQFPAESWEAVYRTLPRNVEVLLDHGRDRLAGFLKERAGHYDYIIVSRIHNMQMFRACVSEIPEVLHGANIIYDAEAVTAPREILYRELQGEKIDAAEKQKLLQDEVREAELADAVVCVSDNEASIYHKQGFPNTYVLGHSLEVSGAIVPLQGRSDLLFVGALRDENSPNVDSLHWFAESVFPELKSKIDGLKLNVVGDSSAPSLAEITDPAIVLHGRQETLTSFYNTNRVFVAPTRFAAGIPHKVHEAAANGVPCVVTSLLAQQLGWQHEQELLVADTATEFAAAVYRLLVEDELWQKLQQGAFARVKSECSPEQFRRVLLSAVGIKKS